MTATFLISLKILLLYSRAYKYIKKENDFKHAGGADAIGSVITSNCVRSTHRPTAL